MMISKEEANDRFEAMAGAAVGSGDPPHPPPFSPQQYHYQQQQYQYGTFGNPGYYQPAVGFPQPAPPVGNSAPSTCSYHPALPPYPAPLQCFAHGYQAIPGYAAFGEGTPLRMPRLPCCGLGIGWFLFILGFFLPAVPWYVGAFVLLCARFDIREKPGFVACAVAAIITAFAIMLGATQLTDAW